ncbi:hypothetical protein OG352_05985 [Streptomyces sp. NBC_01485]|uniref:hypothetical protein n=1 Tax=Streptomyces sp. NBC_01485 TaxID=2903884 RepID=UPI002E35D957|nr:hypothetical protein [Streptomyces sp. NBC_01485]
MRAAEQTELIVLALRDHAAMVEADARAFLAEHDAGVRAESLAEGAGLLREHAARKVGRPVFNAGLRAGAVILEHAADRPASEGDPDFFQRGHTYAREHHAATIRFLVKYIDESPDGIPYRVAFGWKTEDGDVCTSPFDSDNMDGWTDITGEVTP